MKLLLVQWQGDISGSRYTVHQTESYEPIHKFCAIDLLGDPSDTKSLWISVAGLGALTDAHFMALEKEGFIDDKSLEGHLGQIWRKRTGQKEKGQIKSKYIKIKHHKWGLIDEHRAIMQDHLGKKLPRNMVVHHKNGDTHDNRLENLEVMSLSEHTSMHCKEGGWHNRMYQNGLPKNARFTYVEAEAIREMFRRSGESMRRFALSLGLSPRIIEDLVKMKSYA